MIDRNDRIYELDFETIIFIFLFLSSIIDCVNMDTLFTNERDESDDYYAILGCDELSNVCIILHFSRVLSFFSFMIIFF